MITHIVRIALVVGLLPILAFLLAIAVRMDARSARMRQRADRLVSRLRPVIRPYAAVVTLAYLAVAVWKGNPALVGPWLAGAWIACDMAAREAKGELHLGKHATCA